MPGIKAARHVDQVAVSGALKQAAGDHAAVTAFTVDSDRMGIIQRGQSAGEARRVPCVQRRRSARAKLM
jgi:hypothetical protein